MEKSNTNKQVSKGHFGRDLSNCMQNLSLDRVSQSTQTNSKKPAQSFVQQKCKKELVQHQSNKTTANINSSGDEEDLRSFYSSDSCYADGNRTTDMTLNEKESSVYSSVDISFNNETLPPQTIENFYKITNSLFKQLDTCKQEAETSRKIVQSLREELSLLKAKVASKPVDSSFESTPNVEKVMEFYNKKLEQMNETNRKKLLYYTDFEETFNNVQKLQCDVYQRELQSYQRQIKSKDEELKELKSNYFILQQWVITVFKEIGNHANCNSNGDSMKNKRTDNNASIDNNKDCVLTAKDISKAIKLPLKTSNLNSLYRYLVQLLYTEGMDTTD